MAEREAIRRAWEVLLGRDLTLADLDDVNSRDDNWASSGPALMNALLHHLGDDEDAVLSSIQSRLSEVSKLDQIWPHYGT
jgi:hypothetical protein